MDINLLLSTVVLVSFIVTVVLAVGSYLAFKGREVRRPDPELASRSNEPIFFERIHLQPRRADDGARARKSGEVAMPRKSGEVRLSS